jgi:hypothetical protein
MQSEADRANALAPRELDIRPHDALISPVTRILDALADGEIDLAFALAEDLEAELVARRDRPGATA